MKRFVVVNLEYYHEEWEPELRLLYFELCRLAVYRDVEVDGVKLTEGQLLTSQGSLSSLVGRDKSFIRTALKRLAAIGAIQEGRATRATRRKGSPLATVITVNYTKSSLQQDNDGSLKVSNRNQPEIKPEIKPEISDSNVLINNDLTADSSCLKIEIQPEIKAKIQPEISTQHPNFQQLTPPVINNNIIIVDDDVRAQGQKKCNNTKDKPQTPSSEANAPKKGSKASKTDVCRFDPIIALSEFENVIKTALETNPRFGLLVHKAGVKPSQASKYIDEFIALCDIKGEKHRGEGDVLLHFVNYLRKKAEALRRNDIHNEVDRNKILRHGNYQQQEKARFEEVQRELIGDMLGGSRHSCGLPRTSTAYSQSSCVEEDDGDVLELPEIK